MAQFDGIEIPDEMLQTISGGIIDDASRDHIKTLVALFKDAGESVDSIMAGLSSLETDQDWDDIKSLIIELYPIA